MIYAVPATGSPATTGVSGVTGQPAPAESNQLDKDTFLRLMVAQLRNQDPLNPTDSAEFLAQTAQFTSLERLDQVADQTAQALAAQVAFGASSLVGRTVTYTTADGTETTGTVSTVRFGAAGPTLGIGDAEVPLDQVRTVTS